MSTGVLSLSKRYLERLANPSALARQLGEDRPEDSVAETESDLYLK